MDIMELAKEQAVKEHRKMWNWIAEQLENGVESNVSQLKNKYCKASGVHLLDDCFCCNYARIIKGDGCQSCPILWGSEKCSNRFYCEYDESGNVNKGLWWTAQQKSLNHNYKEAAVIAKQIANLPEK